MSMSWFRRRDAHPTDEDLSTYIDVALGGRSASIERHIEACEACTLRLAELREVKSLLGALPRPAASRPFTLGPEHTVAQRRVPERRPAFAFAPAVALSLLVALLAVDFAVVSNESSTTFESRATTDEAGATASKEADQRTLQPAIAPQANDAGAPGAASQPPVAPTLGPTTERLAQDPGLPTPTAVMQPFSEPRPPEREAADGTGSIPRTTSDDGTSNALRALEVVAAIGFVVTLAFYLRRRLA
jgi:hypothetical protein